MRASTSWVPWDQVPVHRVKGDLGADQCHLLRLVPLGRQNLQGYRGPKRTSNAGDHVCQGKICNGFTVNGEDGIPWAKSGTAGGGPVYGGDNEHLSLFDADLSPDASKIAGGQVL